jgi:DNA-binding CsgD family transcriptional regulator/tetratricopeptide (TPR) repeat protein
VDPALARAWPFVGRDEVIHQIRAHVADPAVAAIVVTAPAGTGKTRLVQAAWSSALVPPLWIRASPAVASIPLGAIADLVELEGLDAGATYRRVAGVVADADGIVVVDDLPHLDARTADLLHRLAESGEATIVGTARTGTEVPPWLEWLWLDERTCHIELGPLGPEAIDELVGLVLDGISPSDRRAVVSTLSERTAGNALFVRELLADLARRRAAGEPVALEARAPAHLLRVLDARLRAAGPTVAVPLQAVATLGSLPLQVLEGLLDQQDRGDVGLGRAERDGWIVVEADARATTRAAHPLYAEAAVTAMSAVERRDLVERAAASVLEQGASTSSERLRAVTALLDVGAPVETEALVDGARHAFSVLDHDLANRLAEAAIAAGDRFEAHLVAGAARSGAGRATDAEASLRAALRAAVSDDQLARSAGRLSVHLVAHGSRIDEAAALLDEIDRRLTDPAARSFVAADRAKLASIRGDLTAIGAPANEGDEGDEGDELAQLNAAIVGAYAQAMAGDEPGCRSTIARALPLAEAHRTELPWSAELVRFSGPFAALLAAGPEAAADEARAALASDGPTADATRGTWRFLLGFALVVAGRLDAAAEHLDEAARELDGHDLISARPLALAARAWAAAQSGDVTTARALLDATVEAAAVDGRVAVQVAVADAWCDVFEQGRPTTASTTKLLDAAAAAVDGAQVLSGVLVLHELVRTGDAGAALAPLERIGRSAPSSWLLSVVTERARAHASDDLAGRRRLARRLERSWPLVAAEEHVALGQLLMAQHDEVAAARATLDAHRLAIGLGGTWPVTVAAASDPLTSRERDVADAVARGATNREVADAAGVSVRTVENQLQAVYRKLGVAGRRELRSLLAPASASASAQTSTSPSTPTPT